MIQTSCLHGIGPLFMNLRFIYSFSLCRTQWLASDHNSVSGLSYCRSHQQVHHEGSFMRIFLAMHAFVDDQNEVHTNVCNSFIYMLYKLKACFCVHVPKRMHAYRSTTLPPRLDEWSGHLIIHCDWSESYGMWSLCGEWSLRNVTSQYYITMC